MEDTKKISGKKVKSWITNNAIIILMLVIVIAVGIMKPKFFGTSNLVNTLKNISIRYIIALGISGCLITTGNDLSAGRVAGFAACLAAILAQKAGYSGRFYPNMPELPLLADADNHQIDVVDRPVVGFAVTRDARFGHRPVGNMDVFGQDIDMDEKLLVDAVVAALRLVGPDRVEFVEAVNRDVRKTHHAVPVAAHQLVVKPQRRSAGRESQHEGLHVLENLVRKRIFVVFLDRPHDQIGDIPHAFGFVFEDRGGNLFIAADDVARSRVDDQSSVFGQSVFAVHIRIF